MGIPGKRFTKRKVLSLCISAIETWSSPVVPSHDRGHRPMKHCTQTNRKFFSSSHTHISWTTDCPVIINVNVSIRQGFVFSNHCTIRCGLLPPGGDALYRSGMKNRKRHLSFHNVLDFQFLCVYRHFSPLLRGGHPIRRSSLPCWSFDYHDYSYRRLPHPPTTTPTRSIGVCDRFPLHDIWDNPLFTLFYRQCYRTHKQKHFPR